MMDKALLKRVEKQAWFHRFPRGLPILLFVLSSIVTAISVMAIERANDQAAALELERDATEIAAGIQRRAAENVVVLTAAAALFRAEETVTLDEFRALATQLYSDDAFHGSLGLGWAQRIEANRVWQLEEAMREAYGPLYSVRPEPGAGRRMITPIVFLEPQTRPNFRAIGYDMSSEPVRLAAMELAVSLGRPVASGKVNLVQDADNPEEAGFLIYMPVYAEGAARNAPRGFVYSPFNARKFLQSAATLYGDRGLDIVIYDQRAGRANLLAGRMHVGSGGNWLEKPIQVANRQWILAVSSKTSADLSSLSKATILFGLILAFLLMTLARIATKRAAEDRKVLEYLTDQAGIRNSLNRELNHRVKNTLANVLSIVALTRKRYTEVGVFAEMLTGRIRALSATHDLLSQGEWSNASLKAVIESELAPYRGRDGEHIQLAGPDIELRPNDALSLGLAIHELATNAAKYGALSVPEGRIAIEWERTAPDRVEVRWRETGGPPVQVPQQRGFGLELIEKIVAHELGSKADIRFDPEGVRCTLVVPVRQRAEFALRRKLPPGR
jgi:two-component sensor histidine kinase